MEELKLRLAVKRELRKRMRGVRATMPASVVARRSAEIGGRLGRLEVFERARSVALFWPIEGRNEVDLRPLMAGLWAQGKQVAVPASSEGGAEICLRLLPPGASCEPGPLGFDEPPEGPALDRVDLVVVPALAVDPRGHRIGYGRGYYDRLLSRMENSYTAAVAYDFQLLSEVPDTEGDRAVGWVVTDRRAFRAGEDPGSSFEALADGGVPGEAGEGGEAGEAGEAAAAPAPEAGVKVIARPRPPGVG